MKKRFALLLTALLLLWGAAAPAQESALEGALDGSGWNSYAPVTETRDGGLTAGIVVDGATGHAALAIAQETDGAFSLTAFYEKLIPPQAGIAEMTVEAYDAGSGSWQVPVVTLHFPQDVEGGRNNVRLICWDGEWRPEMLLGGADGSRFVITDLLEQEKISIACLGEEYDALCDADAIDLSQQGFSYEGALAQAGPLFDAYTQKRREDVMAMMRRTFPDEDWTEAELIAWKMWNDEEAAAAAAVIDRGQSRTTYLADTFSPEGGVAMHSLIPAFAVEESIRVSVPHPYDENPDANFPAYLGFETPQGEHYVVEMTRSADNRLRVRAVSFSSDETQICSGTQKDGLLSVYYSTDERATEILTTLPEGFDAPETLDPTAVYAHMHRALTDHDRGEPPLIPEDMHSEYRLPQPCGAALRPGTHDVYSGPGRYYLREADGKACVSTNDWVQVFGREGEWVLVHYRVDGALLRFGYVHESAVQDMADVPVLRFEGEPMLQDNGFVTSNPLGRGGEIRLDGGSAVFTRLCTMGEQWLYVEITLPDGTPARMFAETEPSHG